MSYFHGYDLSLTGSGIVVVDEEGTERYARTVKTDLRGPARLAFIRDVIMEVLEQFPPTVICQEDYAMAIGGKAGRTFSIGELGGSIKLLLFDNEMESILISPTKLKKFVTKAGVAEKDVMMLSVYKTWGYTAKDNDQADAYGLARMALVMFTEDYTGLGKQQIEAVHEVLNPPDKRTKKQKEKDAAKVVKKKRNAPSLGRRTPNAQSN